MFLLKLLERDTDGYRIIAVTDVSFRRLPEPKIVCNPGTSDERAYAIADDAFLLDARGDTIDRFRINRGR